MGWKRWWRARPPQRTPRPPGRPRWRHCPSGPVRRPTYRRSRSGPALLAQTHRLVATDLSPAQIVALARLASTVRPEDIAVRAIDERAVVDRNNGASVLLPRRDVIRQIIGELFGDRPPS